MTQDPKQQSWASSLWGTLANSATAVANAAAAIPTYFSPFLDEGQLVEDLVQAASEELDIVEKAVPMLVEPAVEIANEKEREAEDAKLKITVNALESAETICQEKARQVKRQADVLLQAGVLSSPPPSEMKEEAAKESGESTSLGSARAEASSTLATEAVSPALPGESPDGQEAERPGETSSTDAPATGDAPSTEAVQQDTNVPAETSLSQEQKLEKLSRISKLVSDIRHSLNSIMEAVQAFKRSLGQGVYGLASGAKETGKRAVRAISKPFRKRGTDQDIS